MSNQGMHFYDYSKILSYNAFWNFIIGGRGLGKTYGAKKLAIRAAIRKGEQFVYVRRYKEELKISASTFFADIAHEFPEWEFRVRGEQAIMAKALPDDATAKDEKNRQWITIGFFIPLSTATSRKSVAYPKVKRIIYDEFIIEKGMIRYLPNEVTAFLNLYSTIDRNREETIVLFLANSVSISNPYFLYYKIRPDQVGEFYKSHPVKTREGKNVHFICCHFAESKEFQKDVYNTAFGQFIQNTEYGDYATGNQFLDAHGNMVADKTSEAVYFATIETKSGTFSVWIDHSGRWKRFYIQQKRPNGRESLYTIIPENVGEGKRFMERSTHLLQYLRAGFNNGTVYFDSPQSRNAMIEIFK